MYLEILSKGEHGSLRCGSPVRKDREGHAENLSRNLRPNGKRDVRVAVKLDPLR
jgi:hypothetical protein